MLLKPFNSCSSSHSIHVAQAIQFMLLSHLINVVQAIQFMLLSHLINVVQAINIVQIVEDTD